MLKERRGVGVFLPTRNAVEQAAVHAGERYPRINTAFYHGGEPIRVIRPFLEGDGQKPFLLAMTAAGQSALNVRGMDTVVIDDSRFANVIERGRNVLTRVHLGANEILQMAGRVHGRVENGRVFILSDRNIVFSELRPTAPDFQLAGDSERVAITCADLGVRADELELPVPLDKQSYRRALALLEDRGIVESGRLTHYGKLVEAMPVDRPWAELLVHADDDLVPYVAVMSSVESLHRMTRDDRNLEGLVVPGSDHLTAYNLYAEGFTRCGYIGEVYGLPRHLFDDSVEQWAEERGVLVKAIEDAALGMASVYRALNLELPSKMVLARDHAYGKFVELLAEVMPFDLVIDEETASGDSARVSKTSVCGSWGPIAGTLRYFADRSGIPRAGIEGTQIPAEKIRKHARRGPAEVVYDVRKKHNPLTLRRTLTYFGFDLERESESLEEFPAGLEQETRHALAEALAKGEARHAAVNRNRVAVEEIREIYKRSGGATPRLGLAELTAMYESALGDARSLNDFKASPLRLDLELLIESGARERYAALPDSVPIRDKEVEIGYEVEEDDGGRRGVARLRLPEKVARTLSDAELPRLDRPLRFMVMRGQRGAVRANSLEELQDALDQPWTPDEVGRSDRGDREPSRGGNRDGARGRGGRGDRKGGGGANRGGPRQGSKRGDKRGAPKSRGGGRGRSPRGRR